MGDLETAWLSDKAQVCMWVLHWKSNISVNFMTLMLYGDYLSESCKYFIGKATATAASRDFDEGCGFIPSSHTCFRGLTTRLFTELGDCLPVVDGATCSFTHIMT